MSKRRKRIGLFLLALLGLASILPLAANTGQNDLPGMGVQPVEYFYTGKPYDADSESYTFRYRNYDPELNRWTTVDPSGFPDGANSLIYINNSPLHCFDFEGLQTGLIAGLDITIRVYRSGSWVDITGGGDLIKSSDTRLELIIESDPYDASFMLNANKKPLGGYAVDADPSGSLYPSLANQSIGGHSGLPNVSGAPFWTARYWPTGHQYPMVKLDGSISDMLVGGSWNAVVIYNPNGNPTPLSWSIGGDIVE